LTFCRCHLDLLIFICIYILIIKKRTLKKNLRHPCDYIRHRIGTGCLQFVNRKSFIYLLTNRIYTCLCLGINTYKYGSKKRVGLYIGTLYVIYAAIVGKEGFNKSEREIWGFSDTYNKWYNLSLFNIRNLRDYVNKLKWLEQGDKAHIKCIFYFDLNIQILLVYWCIITLFSDFLQNMIKIID